jgi:hypothetical protein
MAWPSGLRLILIVRKRPFLVHSLRIVCSIQDKQLFALVPGSSRKPVRSAAVPAGLPSARRTFEKIGSWHSRNLPICYNRLRFISDCAHYQQSSCSALEPETILRAFATRSNRFPLRLRLRGLYAQEWLHITGNRNGIQNRRLAAIWSSWSRLPTVKSLRAPVKQDALRRR